MTSMRPKFLLEKSVQVEKKLELYPFLLPYDIKRKPEVCLVTGGRGGYRNSAHPPGRQWITGELI